MQQPHEILGVPEKATQEEINSAYNRKILYANPNNFAQDTTEWKNATKMQKRLQSAYEAMTSQIDSKPTIEQQAVNNPHKNKELHPVSNSKTQTILILCILLVVIATSLYIISYLNKNVLSDKKIPGDEIEENITTIAEKILPATVMIIVEDSQGDIAYGSGFFVNNSGDILTNSHVVEDASDITILTNDKNEYKAKIRAADNRQDIALLSSNTPETESHALRVLDTIPKSGIEIIAAGAPKGLSQTISNGIVSAIRESDGVAYLQITAPISPGSSGGPIVNMDGDVVGISTLSYTSGQNLNFAVSSRHLAVFIPYAERMQPIKLASKKATRPTTRQNMEEDEPEQKSNINLLPLPDENGFMGHAWGCSVNSVKKRLPDLMFIFMDERFTDISCYSTARDFAALRDDINILVIYRFHKDKLLSITYLQKDERQLVRDVVSILTKHYHEKPKVSKAPGGYSYYWVRGNLFVNVQSNKNDQSFQIVFTYLPGWKSMERITPIDDPNSTTAIVTANTATCRSAPSIDAEAVGWPKRGTRLTVHSEQYDNTDGRTWYQVTYTTPNNNKVSGWVSSNVVELEE